MSARLPSRLAIAGRMGSGKTSIARLLMAEHGFVRLAFADELRSMLEPAYGKLDKASSYPLERRVVSGRELLQAHGAALRSVDPYVLIRAIARRAEELPGCRLVIDDVRMPAEAEWLRSTGWFLIQLDADPSARQRRVGAAWSGEDDATEVLGFEAPRIDTTAIEPRSVLRRIEAIYEEEEKQWQA